MAKNQKTPPPPRPDFDTNSKLFRGLSWAMGILCFLFAYMANTIMGTEAEVIQAVLYLFGANLITPPLRRMWGSVLGIRLQGNRLIFAYLGLFLLIMGVGWYGGMRHEQKTTEQEMRQAARSVQKTPLDSLLAPVQSGIFWGYVNTKGKLVIPADHLEQAEPFVNGLARVTAGNERFYINRKGERVEAAEAPTTEADSVQVPLQARAHKGLWGWQDSLGVWVIRPTYDSVGAWGRAYQPASP